MMLGLTITAAAEQLGVTRQTLSNLTNEKISLAPEMSIRLEKLDWGKADAWIRMQANYDLAQVRLIEDEITVYPTAASGENLSSEEQPSYAECCTSGLWPKPDYLYSD